MRAVTSIKRGILWGLVFALNAGCGSLNSLRHADFKTRQPELHALALLPPKAEVVKVAFKGNHETMQELGEEVQRVLREEILDGLKKRGYQMSTTSLEAQQALQNPELQRSLFTVEKILEEKFSKEGPSAFKKFNYSVGPDINVLSEYTQSDALLMAYCFAYKKTGGEITKDILQTIGIAVATLGSVAVYSYPSGAAIHLALIDGDSGNVLWFTSSGMVPINVAKEKDLRKQIRGLVKRLPKAKP
jgi:hypothetical protein